MGPIGSAVLTFIGYKQTNKQTDRQTDKPNLYIEVDIKYLILHEKKTIKKPKYYCEEEKVYIAETGYIISPVGTRSYMKGGGGASLFIKILVTSSTFIPLY